MNSSFSRDHTVSPTKPKITAEKVDLSLSLPHFLNSLWSCSETKLFTTAAAPLRRSSAVSDRQKTVGRFVSANVSEKSQVPAHLFTGTARATVDTTVAVVFQPGCCPIDYLNVPYCTH